MRPDSRPTAVAPCGSGSGSGDLPDLGHIVQMIDPIPGLPDMVFAANGASVSTAPCGARFKHPERAAEAAAYLAGSTGGYPGCTSRAWSTRARGTSWSPGGYCIAGHGFRSGPGHPGRTGSDVRVRAAGVSASGWSIRATTTWTQRCACSTPAPPPHYPAAFDEAGRACSPRRFSELIEASDADAEVLGLNAVSDGRHVVLPGQAPSLAAVGVRSGFERRAAWTCPSCEKGGGSAKCCTLELRH